MKGSKGRIVMLAVILAAGGTTPPATAQLTTPPDWRWVLDDSAALVTGEELADTGWRFVAMPPGWHVTMGPGGIVFHPEYVARGRYALEAEMFLFPGSSAEEYGIFVGGDDYVAFVLRGDGAAAVLRHQGDGWQPVVPWTRHDSVTALPERGTARNVLRIEVETSRVVFRVNGAPVVELPRDQLTLAGRFGLRAGSGINLHVSTLTLTQHLAPPRAR